MSPVLGLVCAAIRIRNMICPFRCGDFMLTPSYGMFFILFLFLFLSRVDAPVRIVRRPSLSVQGVGLYS